MSSTASLPWPATRRWPQEPRAYLAWGNSLYAAGDYAQAAHAFRSATALAPASPQGWNNLAYALLETSCPQQARVAARCAAALAPDDPEYGDTVEEISKLASGIDAGHCQPLDCAVMAP